MHSHPAVSTPPTPYLEPTSWKTALSSCKRQKSLNPKPQFQTLAEEDTLEKNKPLLNQGQVAVLETLDELASGKTVTPTTGAERPRSP
jgi:hypothetical protein